jgi:hypothetical protein
MWLPNSLLACTFVSPCFGCKPKARVVTILMSTMHDLLANDIVVRCVIKGIEGAHVVRLTLSKKGHKYCGKTCIIHNTKNGYQWNMLIAITWRTPNSLQDSKVNPSTRHQKGGRVRARSLTHNILWGRGACWSFRMGLGRVDKLHSLTWACTQPTQGG